MIRRVSVHRVEPSEAEVWDLVNSVLEDQHWADDQSIRIAVRVYYADELPGELELWQRDQLEAAYQDGGTCCLDLRIAPG